MILKKLYCFAKKSEALQKLCMLLMKCLFMHFFQLNVNVELKYGIQAKSNQLYKLCVPELDNIQKCDKTTGNFSTTSMKKRNLILSTEHF